MSSDTFVENSAKALEDGRQFLIQLRAVFGLECEISKQALLLGLLWAGISVFLCFSLLIALNVAVYFAVAAALERDGLLPTRIVVGFNVIATVCCIVTAKRYLCLIGLERTRSLLGILLRGANNYPATDNEANERAAPQSL